MLSGEKVLEEDPEVIPFSTAHATAWAYSALTGTSTNAVVLVGAGESTTFHMYVIAMALVQGASRLFGSAPNLFAK